MAYIVGTIFTYISEKAEYEATRKKTKNVKLPCLLGICYQMISLSKLYTTKILSLPKYQIFLKEK